MRPGKYMSITTAFEICKSDEACVAVQAYGCRNTTALICHDPKQRFANPLNPVPFRRSDRIRQYCLYEKGNVKKLIYYKSSPV